MSIRPYLWVRILLYIGFFIIVFGAWYNWKFSMYVVSDQEYGVKSAENASLLIATQGSEFKDSIATNLIEHYKRNGLYIKVTDVTRLGGYNYEEWDAIFIHHTWEISRPPKQVIEYLNRNEDKSKVVIYSTSGDGRFAIKGVDAISGSSMMNEVKMRTTELINRIDKILS